MIILIFSLLFNIQFSLAALECPESKSLLKIHSDSLELFRVHDVEIKKILSGEGQSNISLNHLFTSDLSNKNASKLIFWSLSESI